MFEQNLNIAMISAHSSPIGELGTQDTGGMSVYIRQVASELGKLGHRVDIFTRMQMPQGEQIVQLAENVRLIFLPAGTKGPIHKWALRSHLKDFFEEIQKFRAAQQLHYDLIHSHYWLSGLVGTLAKAHWKIPHVMLFHTLGILKNLSVGSEREPEFRLRAERELAGTCDRIIAFTDQERLDLICCCGAPAEKIGVVPCGVDLNLFRPMNKGWARSILGFSSEERIVLFVGRFDSVKGLDRLLVAISRLPSHDRLRLLLIGGSGEKTPEQTELQRLSKTLSIAHLVSFAGRIPQEQLPPYYSAADLLVLPSCYESFGLVALEALACGTPVVATQVGAMPRIIRNGINGRLVENGSPEVLAHSIRNTLEEAALFSPQAIRASVAGFEWRKIALGVLEEYRIATRSQSRLPVCPAKTQPRCKRSPLHTALPG